MLRTGMLVHLLQDRGRTRLKLNFGFQFLRLRGGSEPAVKISEPSGPTVSITFEVLCMNRAKFSLDVDSIFDYFRLPFIISDQKVALLSRFLHPTLCTLAAFICLVEIHAFTCPLEMSKSSPVPAAEGSRLCWWATSRRLASGTSTTVPNTLHTYTHLTLPLHLTALA